MRADLPDAPPLQAWMRSNRVVLWSVVLTLLVVVAAGLSGVSHFSGPRWFPRTVIHRLPPRKHKLPPQTQASKPFTVHKDTGSHLPGEILLLLVVAVVVGFVLMVLWRLWMGRRMGAAIGRHSLVAAAPVSQNTVEPEPEADTPALRSGIELALAALDEQRDPADAVVRAWLGLQQTAEESGIVRRPAETPTEFTSRILSQAFADDSAVKTLLRLYLRTRFGDHPVTPQDVADVREALQELVRTWSAPTTAAWRS